MPSTTTRAIRPPCELSEEVRAIRRRSQCRQARNVTAKADPVLLGPIKFKVGSQMPSWLIIVLLLVLVAGYAIQKWMTRHHQNATKRRRFTEQQEGQKQERAFLMRLRQSDPSPIHERRPNSLESQP